MENTVTIERHPVLKLFLAVENHQSKKRKAWTTSSPTQSDVRLLNHADVVRAVADTGSRRVTSVRFHKADNLESHRIKITRR